MGKGKMKNRKTLNGSRKHFVASSLLTMRMDRMNGWMNERMVDRGHDMG